MPKLNYAKLLEKLLLTESLSENVEKRAIVTHFLANHHEQPALATRQEYEDLCAAVDHIPDPESSLKEDDPYQLRLDLSGHKVPFPAPKNPKFKFIDLFAGIGGFRLAFQNLGGECVFTSEWDKYAKQTYEANYGETPYGDITVVPASEVPDHDILCAGFPCQAFSIAGKRGGFDDIRGTLFFDVARIIHTTRQKKLSILR